MRPYRRPRRRPRPARVLASSLFALALAGGALAGPYDPSFAGLGFLPGPNTTYSSASAISADGSTVVGYSGGDVAVAPCEAFRYNRASGTMTGLGWLPTDTRLSLATGVSADGSVIVGWNGDKRSPSSTYSGYQGFRYANGVMTEVGDLPGGRSGSLAYGVSGDGAVIVGESDVSYFHRPPANPVIRVGAFRKANGTMAAIPGMSSSADSRAYGVSGDGTVTVGSDQNLAFRHTASGGAVSLGDLPGGSLWSAALAASRDGSVVVGWGYSASGREAFRWTPSGGMVGMGYLPGAGTPFRSEALAVSPDGLVIVGTS